MQDTSGVASASGHGAPGVDIWLPGIVWRRLCASPDAPAAVHVEWHDGRPRPVSSVSFAEMWGRSQGLARRLEAAGARRGDRVGVFIPASPDWVAAQIAIQLVGAACVPTDVAHASQRLFGQFADAGVSVVITDEEHAPHPRPSGLAFLEVAHRPPESAPDRPPTPDSDDVAYVIYTSGSSGRPKGVKTPHRGLMAFQSAVRGVFGQPGGPFLMLTSPAFDAAIGSLVWGLSEGGPFVTVPASMRVDARALADIIARLEIRRTISLPSVYHRILDEADAGQLDSLRAVLTGGERSTPALVAAHGRKAPAALLVNGYGLTETSIWNTAHRCDPAVDRDEVPIGAAVAGSVVLVLDDQRRPVAPGDIGEVYIGGPCLALGYHDRPDETARRFLTIDHHGERLRVYRTGDRARVGRDGALYFAGRIDRQVKIRGHRVELGEIEAALTDDPTVRRCAVVHRDGAEGGARTVAFVEPIADDPDVRARARARRMAQWSAIDTAVYRQAEVKDALGDDISGWHDSYDGAPIPREEMLRWVANTVQRIQRHRPQRVLEIGCGLGLLLLRIAPGCARYAGIDISPEAVDAVAAEASRRGLGAIVDVKVASADMLDDHVEGTFDTVVINSVAQHFPDVHYLEQTLRSARRRIEGRGLIFVGDVRNRDWLGAFHGSIGLHRLDPDTHARALDRWIDDAIHREGELCLAPAWFETLGERIDGVHSVEIELKAGGDANELTRFRYDVRIFVGDWPERPEADQVARWSDVGDVSGLERWLAAVVEAGLVRGIPSARVGGLISATATASGGMIANIADAARDFGGMEPDDVCRLVADSGLEARASIDPDDPAAWQLAVWRAGRVAPAFAMTSSARPLDAMANDPLFASVAAEVAPGIERRAREALPPAMMPDSIVLRPTLPRTASGKIDYAALSTLSAERARRPSEAPLESDVERQIAHIWSTLLGTDRIGGDDGFFDLGGDSLLLADLRTRLEQAFERPVSMVDLFEHTTVRRLARFLVGTGTGPETQPDAETASSAAGAHGPIAIIGMAVRTPGAADLAGFWRSILDGECHITRRETADGRIVAAGILDDADCFDADLFGITARDAANLDPQQRLFLECAWTALEHAGYRPDAVPGRLGVFGGAGINTYFVNQVLPTLALDGPSSLLETSRQFRTMMGQSGDFLTTRVSYHLGADGPSVALQTGCSTGLVAVHTAIRSLRAGDCDAALAGAVSVRFPQDAGYVAEDGMIFSKDGHCRPFDHRASGTVFGSGVGVVVLKPLDAALADGDPIHAVIRGSAVNNDGGARSGFAAPGVAGQRAVIGAALDHAGVEPETIGYVECHGTATALGDPIELRALGEAWRARQATGGDCTIGSIKANIGHLGNAAGMVGLIKAGLTVRHELRPGLTGFEALNPLCDLGGLPLRADPKPRPWPERATPRRAAVSSFGMGGTNAHVVLEAAPPRPWPVDDGPALFVLCGRTPELLARDARRLLDWMAAHPEIPANVICRALRATRSTGDVQTWSIVGDRSGLQATLRCLSEPLAASSRQHVVLPGPEGQQRLARQIGGRAGDGALPPTWRGWLRTRLDIGPDELWRETDDGRTAWPWDPVPNLARCSLPPRPLVRERFWMDASPPHPSPGRATPNTRPVADSTGCFEETWCRVDAPSTPSSSWLLVCPPGADDPALADVVRALSPAVRVDWSGQLPEKTPRLIVSLLGLDTRSLPGEAGLTRGLKGTIELARAMAARRDCRLWVVTRGAVSIAGEPVCPTQHMLWGFGRTFGLERPDVWGGLVDLPSRLDPATRALVEHAVGSGEDQIAIRGRRVWGRRLAAHSGLGPGRWRTSGTALVTGGTGGLGRVLADWLVRQGAERVVLTGRRAVPVEQPSGGAIESVACDVTHREALTNLVESIDGDGPPLRSVFHLAGAVEPAGVVDIDMQRVGAGLSAKVVGLDQLEAALGERELDARVWFSSGAAAWGSAGLSIYAAANAYLDAHAVASRRDGHATWSIAWGMWDVDGMANADTRARMSRQGTPTMAPDDALALLERALCAPPGNIIISRFDWPHFSAAYHARRAWPLWSHLDPDGSTEGARSTRGSTPDTEPDEASSRDAPMVDEPTFRQAILTAMRDLLGDQSATEADLVEIADDSLLAIELSDAVKQAIGIDIPVLAFIEGMTMDELTGFVLGDT